MTIYLVRLTIDEIIGDTYATNEEELKAIVTAYVRMYYGWDNVTVDLDMAEREIHVRAPDDDGDQMFKFISLERESCKPR